MYDIIGDIHGFADTLELLLDKLGYTKSKGIYKHPKRKVMFTGDFIDRGPKIRKTLEIVREMVENEFALTVAGNHEFNALAYETKDESGRYLRPHSKKNNTQILKTLEEFKHHPAEWKAHLNWFKTLPIYLETNELRIIHACWNPSMIDDLKSKNISTLSNPDFLEQANNKESEEYRIIETLLKGSETTLPNGFSFLDKDNNRRNSIRLRWWSSLAGKTYKEAAVNPHGIPDIPVPETIQNTNLPYPDTDKPVFFGHYWRTGKPQIQSKNVCCVDYSIGKCHKLTAYRFDGEQELDNSKFLTVNCIDKL